MNNKLAYIFAFISLLSTTSLAKIVADTNIKDQISVSGENLVLNGAGIRKKLFMNVYIGALYLGVKSKDAESIANSSSLKVIELTFLRNVDGEKISSAFLDGFAKNCVQNCTELKPKMEELAKAVPAIKEGQIMQLVSTSDSVKLLMDNSLKAEIQAKNLGNEVIRLFIGKEPPSEDLKKELLGN
jgi:hypothetical protein